MKIDAHHHFWKYDPLEYNWINQEMSVIQRDFLPADLEKEIRDAGVDGVVSVQARTSLEETRWLLHLAGQNDFILGVVGWVPMTATHLRDELISLRGLPKLRSVREICQGQPAGSMLRPEFLAGIATLTEFNLAYDVLIFENQLTEATEMVDRFPNQIFVLDHIAKPRIRDLAIEPWAKNIRELAKRENVFCKLSGFVTEANWSDWTMNQLQPYFETVMEAFGSRRAMFGSDWPVCLVASSYQLWFKIFCDFASHLSSDEQKHVLGGTAAHAYNLNTQLSQSHPNPNKL